MTKAERRARFEVAIEVAQSVYKDMCQDRDVRKEQVYEFCELLTEMYQFSETLKPEASLDDVIRGCEKLKERHVDFSKTMGNSLDR